MVEKRKDEKRMIERCFLRKFPFTFAHGRWIFNFETVANFYKLMFDKERKIGKR